MLGCNTKAVRPLNIIWYLSSNFAARRPTVLMTALPNSVSEWRTYSVISRKMMSTFNSSARRHSIFSLHFRAGVGSLEHCTKKSFKYGLKSSGRSFAKATMCSSTIICTSLGPSACLQRALTIFDSVAVFLDPKYQCVEATCSTTPAFGLLRRGRDAASSLR